MVSAVGSYLEPSAIWAGKADFFFLPSIAYLLWDMLWRDSAALFTDLFPEIIFLDQDTALSMFLQLQFHLLPQEIISRWGREGGLFQNNDYLPGEKPSFIPRTAKTTRMVNRLRSKSYLNFIRNASSFDLWGFLCTSHFTFCLKFSIHIIDQCLNYSESISYIIIIEGFLLIWYQKCFFWHC